jgi:aerobic-type carbon monoxide dehydrogenase small subunit (CoxS/CutS family)
MSEPTRSITITVNGTQQDSVVATRTLLSDHLRHGLGLTGTHVGCEQGVCGSCTVLVDGEPMRSCLMLAVQADGRSIETVESLSGGCDRLCGIQQSMLDNHGLQCGFCTPGILMSLTAADRSNLTVDEAETEVLGGHVCRCTGYNGIRAAIRAHWGEKVSQS